MKKFDGWDICLYVVILPLTILSATMMILSVIGIHCQTESFIDQNDYCVVVNKDSRLVPQVSGKFVTTRRVSRINAVGLTTQDTLEVDINRRLFGDIEIGDTIKTINLK